MSPLAEQVMDVATDRLVQVDQKGYFTFAKSGIRVVDQIVTNFSDDDVQALGDNVVLILNTVKELTQPEIMAVLGRMIEAVQRQQAADGDGARARTESVPPRHAHARPRHPQGPRPGAQHARRGVRGRPHP